MFFAVVVVVSFGDVMSFVHMKFDQFALILNMIGYHCDLHIIQTLSIGCFPALKFLQ